MKQDTHTINHCQTTQKSHKDHRIQKSHTKYQMHHTNYTTRLKKTLFPTTKNARSKSEILTEFT